MLYFDLNKAMNPDLVKVLRPVTKGGKTHMQHFWVRPSQVTKNDQVVGNKGVYDAYITSQKAIQNSQQKAKSKIDFAKFNAYKDAKDRDSAIQYAKSCGVSWDEHANSAINWMRLCMAVSKLSDTTVMVNKKAPKSSVTDLSGLDKAAFDAADSKIKVKQMVTTFGRDKTMSIAKQLGVSWTDSPNEGINWMRASIAIQKYVENKTLDQLSGGNSPATTVANNPKPDTKPLNEIEILPSHSDRDKAIISLINKITDKDDIELYTKSGMIAEDDEAKEYLKNTLMKKYKNSSSNNSSRCYSSVTREEVMTLLSKPFKGVPKKNIKQALRRSEFVDDKTFANMMVPRGSADNFTKVSTTVPKLIQKLSNFGQDIWLENNTYVGNQGARSVYTSFGGINVEDFQSSEKSDVNNHGICKVLEHIKTSDPEYAPECDRMKKCYTEMMKICGNNYLLLSTILECPWDTDPNYWRQTATITKIKDLYNKADKTITALLSELKKLNLSPEDTNETLRRLVSSYVSDRYWSQSAAIFPYWDKDGNQLGDLDCTQNPVLRDAVGNISISFTSIMSSLARTYTTGETPKIIETLNELTEDKYDRIHELQMEMLRYEPYDISAHAPISLKPHEIPQRQFEEDYSPHYSGDHPETDAVLSNMLKIGNTNSFLEQIAKGDFAPSAANSQGEDYSVNCDYHVENLGLRKAYGWAPSKYSNIDEVKAKKQEQLNKMNVIKYSDFKSIKQEIDDTGKTGIIGQERYSDSQSRALSVSINYLGMQNKSSIGYKLFQDQIDTVVQFLPQIKTTRVKTDEDVKKWVHKTIGINSDDLWKPKSNTSSGNNTQLLDLRKKLFDKANCSLRTMSDSEQKDLLHQVKMDFDYVDNGKRVPIGQRAYANRTLVFHGHTYEVNNSNNQEKLKEEAQKLNETPQLMYHGTSYSAATSIVGVEGEFRISGKDADSRSGTMLGNGIYSAKLVGKTLPYIGNNTYSYDSYDQSTEYSPGDACDGILLVCEGVLGKSYHSSTSTYDARYHNDGTYDSISAGAGASMGGSTLKEFERVVTRKSMIAPKYIVDCGARKYDRSIK